MANETDIKNFFKGRKASYDLFVHLRSAIEKICLPDIEVSKTQISFGEEYKYLWVWLPQAWIAKRPETSLTLTVLSGEKIENKRIVESVQPKEGGYWTHHILIENKDDIDSDIHELIKASYEFYLNRKHNKELKRSRK